MLDKCHLKTFCKFFQGAHRLRFWALLQLLDEGKERIIDACKLLESIAYSVEWMVLRLSSWTLVLNM
jgi:hypothetical protein